MMFQSGQYTKLLTVRFERRINIKMENDTINETEEQVETSEVLENNNNSEIEVTDPLPDKQTDNVKSPLSESQPALDIDTLFTNHTEEIKDFLSKLTAPSPEADTRETELEAKAKELEKKEQFLNLQKLRFDTVKILEQENLPSNAVRFVLGKDLKATQENISEFKTMFDKGVQKAVEERLVGKSPRYGNSNKDDTDSTQSTIRNIMNGRK